MATIHPSKNGPYMAKGCQLVDADGNVIEDKQTMALCRCGGSDNKPFCDGTHKDNGFEAE